MGLKEESIWARLRELRDNARARARKAQPASAEPDSEKQTAHAGPALPQERELLEVLLANPGLVRTAFLEIQLEQIQHPVLRALLEGLYELHSEGEPPTLDLLRARLDNSPLAAKALQLQEVGRMNPDSETWLQRLVAEFRRKYHLEPQHQELKSKLQNANDHA